MIFATCVAGFGSVWGLLSKGTPGYLALGALAIMLLLGILGFLKNESDWKSKGVSADLNENDDNRND